MLRAILWLLAIVLIYRTWMNLRKAFSDTPSVRGPAVKNRQVDIDRSQIVDAEFRELDEDEKDR